MTNDQIEPDIVPVFGPHSFVIHHSNFVVLIYLETGSLKKS